MKKDQQKSKEPQTPMPSRPNLPPPELPRGAKPIHLKPEGYSSILKKDGRSSRRISLPFLLLILIFVLLLGVGFLAAKTGVYHIPLLSSLLYSGGKQPTRVVTSASIAPADFQQTLEKRIIETKPALDGSIGVEMTEQEATGVFKGMLREILLASGSTVEEPQIVITKTNIEVSGVFKNAGSSFDLLMKAVPVVSGDRVSLRVEEAYLGDVRLPADSFSALEDKIFHRSLASFEAKYDGMNIKDVQLGDGSVRILFVPLAGAL